MSINREGIILDMLGLAVSALSGLAGGNLTGAALKDKSLGAIGNSIAGLIGGVAGTYILQAVNVLEAVGLANVSLGEVAGMIGSGAVGGGILTALVGFIKNAMLKK